MRSALLPLAAAYLLLLAGSCAGHRRLMALPLVSSDTLSVGNQEPLRPFQAGYQYNYTYHGQISSGLSTATDSFGNTGSSEAQQKAATRIQANVQLTFTSDTKATLRLDQIRIGQLNKKLEVPEEVQPLAMFLTKTMEQGKARQLSLPCQFEYAQGVVRQVQFHAEDGTWSKNIKRAVLNLIQLNLKQQTTDGSAIPAGSQEQDCANEEECQPDAKTFTLLEITMEGECQTTYSINKNDQQAQWKNSQQQQQPENGGQPMQQKFNVTKSINFKQCAKIADVAFGFQSQQPQLECIQCQKQWSKLQEQLQGQAPQQSAQSNPCTRCDPKEVKERRLDRSTVFRYVVSGSLQPDQQFAIERAELISQYLYKNIRTDNADYSTSMQTVVAAQLLFRNCHPIQQQEEEVQVVDEPEKNTILYDNQWEVDEKRFYMNGDEQEFAQGKTPFGDMVKKVEQAQQILGKLAQAASNKASGIEFAVSIQLQRLVELFRMCTVEELEQVFTTAIQSVSALPRSESEAPKMKQLVADCLAMAGTRNTIYVLVSKIISQELSELQAFQALQSLMGLPAPSEKQADILLNLCHNEVVQNSAMLKQACWLTCGTVIGELCQQRGHNDDQEKVFGAQSGFKPNNDMCNTEKKETYKQALVEQYEKAVSTYEKVLALKAIGNAGIDTTIGQLQKIVANREQRQEPRLVRIQAIDAMRRLRAQMPRKIQRVLLPILQNAREQPEVRMAAFSMIMHTQPEQPIVDQIAYTLIKERNKDVQSYVYTTMKVFSKSKVPGEQQLGKHLKNVLKMANVDERKLRLSRKYQVPIYSNEQKEGVFVTLASVFNSRTKVPSELSAALDTFLSEEYQRNTFKISLSQENLEQWYESMVQNFILRQRQQSQMGGQPNGDWTDTISQFNNNYKLDGYPQALLLNDDQQQQQEGQQQPLDREPFAIFCVRIGDVDQVIVPVDGDTLPDMVRQMLAGERPSRELLEKEASQTKHFRMLKAMNVAERSARIPTSIGVPLRILHARPVLTALEGSTNMDVEGRQSSFKAQVNVHSSGCVAHIQKMESWLPILATGVECFRAIEWNAPIQSQIEADKEQGLKVSLKTPQAQSTHLLGAHSLPSTYTRDWDPKMKVLKAPKMIAIHQTQLEELQGEVDKEVGTHTLGLPLRIVGHYHWPQGVQDYKQVMQLLASTENHLHVTFERKEGLTPKEIVFRATASTFQPVSSNPNNAHGSELNNFYAKGRKFERAHPEDDYDEESEKSQEDRRRRLQSTISQTQSTPAYQHSLKLSAETRGGGKKAKGQLQLRQTCDANFQVCKVQMDVERSPMLDGENSDWSLKGKIQWMRPDAQQQQHSKNSPSIIWQSDCEWGVAGRKQNIQVRIKGEQFITQEQRQQLAEKGVQMRQYSVSINKFDIAAEYKLQAPAQQVCSRALELVKSHDYWNTDSHWQQGQEGKLHATVVMDPVGQKYANVSVRTPTQAIRIRSIPLPAALKYVRPLLKLESSSGSSSRKATHSMPQLLRRLAVAKGRAQCSADGTRVKTFDGVVYKAPIGKCYSVMANDCGSRTGGQKPRFFVLIKSIAGQQVEQQNQEENSQDKKIKVITPRQTITCQPSTTSQNHNKNNQRKLECKVNGRPVTANEQEQQQQEQQEEEDNQVVEYDGQQQKEATITVEGVQVRMACTCRDCQCQKVWVRISSQLKNAQCGLCGHYDDQTEGELRMANNQQTEDVAAFHRSHSLAKDSQECTPAHRDAFYGSQNRHRFGPAEEQDYEPSTPHDRFKKSHQNSNKMAQQDYQQQDQWDGSSSSFYDHGSSSEEQWQSGSKDQWDQPWKKQQQQQRQQQDSGEQNTEEPIEQTDVVEMNHKICFSVKPIKKCPKGTWPVNNSEDTDEYPSAASSSTTGQKNNGKKVQYVCFDRHSVQTRRLQRQVRQGKSVQMGDRSPSFAEPINEPSACVAY